MNGHGLIDGMNVVKQLVIAKDVNRQAQVEQDPCVAQTRRGWRGHGILTEGEALRTFRLIDGFRCTRALRRDMTSTTAVMADEMIDSSHGHPCRVAGLLNGRMRFGFFWL